MDWLTYILRGFFSFLDKIVYGAINSVYNLFTDIAGTTIFSEAIFSEFASKIYALLGVFMLFKVSFSILTYVVNPDAFYDKSKGFSKLISNILVTLGILIVTPWIFTQAMALQQLILRDNVIGKVFTGINEQTSLSYSLNAGANMSFDVMRAFYYFDEELYPDCEGLADSDSTVLNAPVCEEALQVDDFEAIQHTLSVANATKSVDIYMSDDLLYAVDENNVPLMKYTPGLSTLAGGFVAWMLILFCFDIAVRSVKLGFLRMIAPIPIISRIDPKKGTEVFNKWLKSVSSTYLDLFIRLLGIYFAIFIISSLDLQMVNAVTGAEEEVSALVTVFIILGALLFAKQLPKLIKDITGFDLGGKFELNPLKKLNEVPGVEKGLSTLGGTVAGARAGRQAGNTALGAALGAAKGFNSSKLMGDGKGGFRKALDSTYKGMTGNDFVNFQWKPGGKKAVSNIGDELGKLFGVKDEIAQRMADSRMVTENAASDLVKNGVRPSDIKDDDVLNARAAQAGAPLKIDKEINDLKTALNNTTDATERNRIQEQIASKQNRSDMIKANYESVIKYSAGRDEEMRLRKISTDVEKDIDRMKKEKSQRESFYGIDPAPPAAISEIKERTFVEQGEKYDLDRYLANKKNQGK